MDLRRLGEGDIVSWFGLGCTRPVYHQVDAHVNASRSHDLHESRAWPLFKLITLGLYHINREHL